MNLEPTGKRMVVEHYHATAEAHFIYLMHVATYAYAEPLCAGKRVLDYGCGSGYGSARIAGVAREVVAVDVAPDAVAYAAERFARSNLRFDAIDPTQPLPFPDASFDTVLSFQVFEHVEDPDRYLAEVRRVLAPGGTLMLVTPDRSTRLFPGQRPWNRWHRTEYGEDGLRQILAGHFRAPTLLAMGGTPAALAPELRRCRRLRWLTLPFTLPGAPEAWRQAGLNALHRLQAWARGGRPAGPGGPFPATEADVVIGAGQAPSLNLVALATKDL